ATPCPPRSCGTARQWSLPGRSPSAPARNRGFPSSSPSPVSPPSKAFLAGHRIRGPHPSMEPGLTPEYAVPIRRRGPSVAPSSISDLPTQASHCRALGTSVLSATHEWTKISSGWATGTPEAILNQAPTPVLGRKPVLIPPECLYAMRHTVCLSYTGFV